MAKWLLGWINFRHKADARRDIQVDERQMREAVARARATLEARGRLEVELEAQREIRERVRSAA